MIDLSHNGRESLLGSTPLGLRLELWICVALVTVTLGLYAPVLFHDFVEFDDGLFVTNKPLVQQGLTVEGIGWAFTNFEARNWHPLTWLSHMLDCTLFGAFAGGHHLSNLALHALNALLLFLLLRRLTGATWRSGMVAALFAWHPLHVESVAWVAERRDTLSTLFLILTLWAYLRYAERPGWGRYIWVLVCYALGLMSKPMLVTLPLLLMLMDFWPLGRMRAGHEQRQRPLPPFTALLEARIFPLFRLFHQSNALATEDAVGGEPFAGQSRSTQSSRSRLKRVLTYTFRENQDLVLEKLPLFALAAFSCVVTLWAQHQGGAIRSLDAIPLDLRLANACVAYGAYLWKTVCPLDLAVFYPLPMAVPWLWLLLSSLAVAVISSVVARHGKHRPYLIVGWLWYLVALLPVIGLIQVGGAAYADRYTYVPLIGVFMVLVWSASDWLQRADVGRPWQIIVAGAACLACAWGTAGQLRHWRDGIQLFTRAISVTRNNYLAHNNLGVALSRRGFKLEGTEHYRTALQLNPRFTIAQNNLADAYYNQGVDLASAGQVPQAMTRFAEALDLRPGDADTHHNLGTLLAQQARYAEAIDHLTVAVRQRPENARARFNLAQALEHHGDLPAAIAQYRAALQLRPNWPEAQAALTRASAHAGTQ